ncbi:germacradienol/geosmin synthase, partial [Streptomyces fuscigenes]|nr:germacradienol/geosmin synthase [Streptomyces fuscigenes]
CADFELDGAARAALAGYVKELENWLSGILVWHEGCHRYTEADPRRASRVVPPAPPRTGGGDGGGRRSGARVSRAPALRVRGCARGG